ncbi:hypothetical protein H5410_048955 [Solanum commersonii]|uniref:Uncharacterized protein n=1 Tax=Solanum commersonii TaxID=4109 RepID=A0A9J5XJQ1_SOLCO|nr:hypothetical protein H5410_048955 [Solanum commersonii]
MEMSLDEILIIMVNTFMDRVLMVRTAFRSTTRSMLEFSILWKEVEDLLKPINGCPQTLCNSHHGNGKIIFITMKNNIIMCYFYDARKNN